MRATRGRGRGRPPLPTASTRQNTATSVVPASVAGRTPAAAGTRSSPRHTHSTQAAVSADTDLSARAQTKEISASPEEPSDPVVTSLFPQTPVVPHLPPIPPPHSSPTGSSDDNSSTSNASSHNNNNNSTGYAAAAGADENNFGDSIVNSFDVNYGGNNDFEDDAIIGASDDASNNDFAADTYDFNARLHHYMEYTEISSRNIRAVEYCIMTQANTIVYNNQTKGRVDLEEESVRVYLQLIRDIPSAYFANNAVRTGMLQGYTGMRGKTAGNAKIAAGPFVRKLKKVVAKVRLFASNFPTTLPSGSTPCDLRKAFIVKVWKEDRLAQKKGEEVSHINFNMLHRFHSNIYRSF